MGSLSAWAGSPMIQRHLTICVPFDLPFGWDADGEMGRGGDEERGELTGFLSGSCQLCGLSQSTVANAPAFLPPLSCPPCLLCRLVLPPAQSINRFMAFRENGVTLDPSRPLVPCPPILPSQLGSIDHFMIFGADIHPPAPSSPPPPCTVGQHRPLHDLRSRCHPPRPRGPQ